VCFLSARAVGKWKCGVVGAEESRVKVGLRDAWRFALLFWKQRW
jgi:hypothetical protein